MQFHLESYPFPDSEVMDWIELHPLVYCAHWHKSRACAYLLPLGGQPVDATHRVGVHRRKRAGNDARNAWYRWESEPPPSRRRSRKAETLP